MSTVDSQRLTDSKVAALLQPIKDLASAWEIDIANELDDYMEQIAKLNLDTVGDHLNFAEAALLIQGSASLYSRKVEHLYKLLFQVLDVLIHKKQQDKPVEGEESESIDLEPVVPENDEPKLLSLDDLEECANIDLDEEHRLGVGILSPISRMKHTVDDFENIVHREEEFSLANFGPISLDNCFVHESGALLLSENDSAILEHNSADRQNMVLDNIPEDDDEDYQGGGFDTVEMDHSEFHGDKKDFQGVGVQLGERRDDVADLINRWEMMDPYEESSSKDTSFRKGKTWRDSVDKDKSGRSWKTITQELVDGFLSPSEISSIDRRSSLRFPSSACFDHLVERERQRQRSSKKPSGKPEESSNKWSSLKELTEGHRNHPCSDDEFEGGLGNEFDNGDDMPYEHITDDAFPEDGDHGEPAEEMEKFESYEDHCRRHLEEYIRNSEQFAFETDISRKVSEWRGKIQPILEEEEQHPDFDIDNYGNQVLDEIQHTRKTQLTFDQVVKGRNRYDVCRMFLATLMLANHENVELSKSKSNDNFQVKFKNRALHSESLKSGVSS